MVYLCICFKRNEIFNNIFCAVYYVNKIVILYALDIFNAINVSITALYCIILKWFWQAWMYFRCCLMSLEYEMKIQSIVILSALDISTYVCLFSSQNSLSLLWRNLKFLRRICSHCINSHSKIFLPCKFMRTVKWIFNVIIIGVKLQSHYYNKLSLFHLALFLRN